MGEDSADGGNFEWGSTVTTSYLPENNDADTTNDFVVGEVNNFNQIEVIGNSEIKCSGIQKGQIIDEEQIVNAIKQNRLPQN